MSSSRTSQPKFTLRPSSLSQHTANFNKLLEQVPAPKIDNIDLIKSLEHKQDSNLPEAKLKEKDETETKEFVFGEKLNDRVINTPAESSANTDSSTNETNTRNTTNKSNESSSTSATTATTNENGQNINSSTSNHLWTNNNENESEKYSTELIENIDSNTLLKLNCKLYVLETDKVNWLERGYGILKLIDSNDGINCKIMMWTDKTFRLILNTKLFEKMQIDKANKKSIRFNAYDSGTIKIMLVKTANQNDCDELFSKLKERLNEFNSNISKESNDINRNEDSSSNHALNETNKKDILFKCNCDFYANSSQSSKDVKDEEKKVEAKIHLFKYAHLADTNKTTNHQLFLDVVDSNDESKIYLSTYLKLIKLENRKSNSSDESNNRVSFIINESFKSSSSSSSKLKYTVTIDDKDSSSKFLNYYSKEPKFHTNPDDSSNEEEQESSENESSDQDSEENEEFSTPTSKSQNESESANNRLSERDTSLNEQNNINNTNNNKYNNEINEESETGELSRKRKIESSTDDDIEEPNKKPDLDNNNKVDNNETTTTNSKNIKKNFDEINDYKDDESNDQIQANEMKKTKISDESEQQS